MLRVKLICNWCTSSLLVNEWGLMTESVDSIEDIRTGHTTRFIYKNIELVSDEPADYYVIINMPYSPTVHYVPERTIVFQMEPWVSDPSLNWGVKTWGDWAQPDENKFLAVRGRQQHVHNNAFWELELSLKELRTMSFSNKRDTLSSMCSSKYYDPGHILRVDLLKYLENKRDIPLDIFSYDNNLNFKNYRGPLYHYVNKSQGYVDYKYYFMMENNFEMNFITEKVYEPILCECLVFYFGCPNVTEYIDEKAIVILDPNNFEKCYETIKTAIRENWWELRLPYIQQMKKKILDELCFLPVIHKILNNKHDTQ